MNQNTAPIMSFLHASGSLFADNTRIDLNIFSLFSASSSGSNRPGVDVNMKELSPLGWIDDQARPAKFFQIQARGKIDQQQQRLTPQCISDGHAKERKHFLDPDEYLPVAEAVDTASLPKSNLRSCKIDQKQEEAIIDLLTDTFKSNRIAKILRPTRQFQRVSFACAPLA